MHCCFFPQATSQQSLKFGCMVESKETHEVSNCLSYAVKCLVKVQIYACVNDHNRYEKQFFYRNSTSEDGKGLSNSLCLCNKKGWKNFNIILL